MSESPADPIAAQVDQLLAECRDCEFADGWLARNDVEEVLTSLLTARAEEERVFEAVVHKVSDILCSFCLALNWCGWKACWKCGLLLPTAQKPAPLAQTNRPAFDIFRKQWW